MLRLVLPSQRFHFLLRQSFDFLEVEGRFDQVFQLLECEYVVANSVFGVVAQLIWSAVLLVLRLLLG